MNDLPQKKTHRNRREPAQQDVALPRSRRRAGQEGRGETRDDHRWKEEDKERKVWRSKAKHTQSREREKKNEKNGGKKLSFLSGVFTKTHPVFF